MPFRNLMNIGSVMPSPKRLIPMGSAAVVNEFSYESTRGNNLESDKAAVR